MTDYEFRHATLKSIRQRIKILKEKEKEKQDLLQFIPWDIGMHVRIAIVSAFDKKAKYPDNPLAVKEVVVTDMELTDEEKEKWARKWFKRLERISKPAKKNE